MRLDLVDEEVRLDLVDEEDRRAMQQEPQSQQIELRVRGFAPNLCPVALLVRDQITPRPHVQVDIFYDCAARDEQA